MFSNANAHMLLTAISISRGKTVKLDYGLYRRRFSVSQVPPIRTIRDLEGNPTFVDVDKEKAINFLKNQHQFYTKAEMEMELKDVASDFSRIVQRE